jgi:hypothetical protein
VRSVSRLCWLGAALALTALWISRSLAPLLSPFAVQDDARQHVFWMQRLADPSLLRGDLYADYFASQAPPAFVLLYRALLPIASPLTTSKLLPAILGLLAALFTFLLVERLTSSRPAAFLATILGGWYAWQYDDLATGSPRAFLLPLTALLLYGLTAGWRWWLIVLVVAAEALVYPSAAALGVVLVGMWLVRLDRWPPRLCLDWRAWRAVVASGLVAVALLLPTVLGETAFGPAVSASAARQMPEFGPNGRTAFFVPSAYTYWIESYRSGFDLRVADALVPGIPIFYELLALALALPAALAMGRIRPGRPLTPAVALVLRVVLGSLVLFLAAHLLLFRLYLPARFVAWTVPLALAIAAGTGIAALIEGRALSLLLSGLLAAVLIFYPAHYDANVVLDKTPRLTAYLRGLPPDTVVLAPPVESDSVPAFSGRRVLMNREYALAYHQGYYAEVERRVRAGIDAYYAETPARVVSLADQYGVTVVIVDPGAFDPATAADIWAGSFEPYTSLVLERLSEKRRFALMDERRRCGAMSEAGLTVIPVSCLRSRG